MSTNDGFIPFAPNTTLTGARRSSRLTEAQVMLERAIRTFEQFRAQATLRSVPSSEHGRFTSTGVWLSLVESSRSLP